MRYQESENTKAFEAKGVCIILIIYTQPYAPPQAPPHRSAIYILIYAQNVRTENLVRTLFVYYRGGYYTRQMHQLGTPIFSLFYE